MERREALRRRAEREGGRGGGGGFWDTSAGLARDVRVAQPSTVRRHTKIHTFTPTRCRRRTTDETCGAKFRLARCPSTCARIRVPPCVHACTVPLRFFRYAANFVFFFLFLFFLFLPALGRRWRPRFHTRRSLISSDFPFRLSRRLCFYSSSLSTPLPSCNSSSSSSSASFLSPLLLLYSSPQRQGPAPCRATRTCSG